MALYPDSETAWLLLGVGRAFEDPGGSQAILARAVKALPYSPLLQNVFGYAQLSTGRIEDALRPFETYAKLRPSEPNALDSWAEGLLVSGDIAGALARYDQALRGGYTGARSGKAWTLAVDGRYPEAMALFGESPSPSIGLSSLLSRVGRYREAGISLNAFRSTSERNENTEQVVAVHLVKGMFRLEQGNCDEVASQLNEADRAGASLPPAVVSKWRVFVDLLAGVCDVRHGRLDSARRHATHAKSIYHSTSPGERWWVSALDGEIALAERDYSRAARAFADGEAPRKMYFARQGIWVPLSFLSNNLVLRDGRARVAVAQGKFDEAIALYRGLLTPGSQQKWTAMLDPLHVIALARVLEKAGQRDAARAEYQRFLTLWKDADKELPELAEARAALAR